MTLYKLYKNGNVKVLLDMSYYYNDIVDSLGYSIDSPLIDFTIAEYDGVHEREYARIRSVEDYVRIKYIDNPKVLRKEKLWFY